MVGKVRIPILLVESDVRQSRALSTLLETAGYVVRVADDAREGLTGLRIFRPKVVLLDLGLPNMSGYHLARTIRKEPGFETVPIIALTAMDWRRIESSPNKPAFAITCKSPLRLPSSRMF